MGLVASIDEHERDKRRQLVMCDVMCPRDGKTILSQSPHLNNHTSGFHPQTQMLELAPCKTYEHHLNTLLIQDVSIERSHALQSFIFTDSKVRTS